MSQGKITALADRGVVAVTGPDAHKLLQGLITNDVDQLESKSAVFAALLSPQGKILFDFLVTKGPSGLLLECPRSMAADLIKRLTLYRLRAAVEIKDNSDQYVVLAQWGPHTSTGETAGTVSFADPRLSGLGRRILAETHCTSNIAATTGATNASTADYHEHRIALGVPEGGKDFTYGDAFPHEACMDLLNGISFTKGCYVGQEIVARMEHRGTARKRIVPVSAGVPLPAPGADIKAGEVVIGTLGSTAGHRGLAMIRLDRAAEFQDKAIPLAAGNVAIAIELPPWATFAIAKAASDTGT